MAEDECKFCHRPIEGMGAGETRGGKRVHKNCVDIILEEALKDGVHIGPIKDGRK